MSDEDFAAANGAGNSHAPGKHRGPRFSWTPAYEATFFRSLCESVSLGLREGSTFKHEAWERAIQTLIERHNAYAHKNHLINKSDNARKKFRLWRGLREAPEFHYDHSTRMVTASEDAWKRHIEKEPLSRSLKGRPFEHEEYYEVLFPDVVGSGGAPKRLTKPRRRDGDGSNGPGDQDGPGTAVMDILADTSYASAVQTHIPPPQLPPATMAPSAIAPPPTHHHPRQTPTAMPPRPSISSSSALTPPEDPSLHPRKRYQAPDVGNPVNSVGQQQQDKRRRTTATTYLDLTQSGTPIAPPAPSSAVPISAPQAPPPPMQLQQLQPPPPPPQHMDGVAVLVDAIRTAKVRAAWSEQAVEVFFREFNDEDMDLQLKIAEKMLTDENKAMVFCKMPDTLRKHWVRRLREMHNQRMG